VEEETHHERHVVLHKHLDELFADAVMHGGIRTTNTVLDLIEWSYKQTQKPDHKEETCQTN